MFARSGKGSICPIIDARKMLSLLGLMPAQASRLSDEVTGRPLSALLLCFFQDYGAQETLSSKNFLETIKWADSHVVLMCPVGCRRHGRHCKRGQ
jgi:hypothetical protein